VECEQLALDRLKRSSITEELKAEEKN